LIVYVLQRIGVSTTSISVAAVGSLSHLNFEAKLGLALTLNKGILGLSKVRNSHFVATLVEVHHGSSVGITNLPVIDHL
jgi:hypothetical protein